MSPEKTNRSERENNAGILALQRTKGQIQHQGQRKMIDSPHKRTTNPKNKTPEGTQVIIITHEAHILVHC